MGVGNLSLNVAGCSHRVLEYAVEHDGKFGPDNDEWENWKHSTDIVWEDGQFEMYDDWKNL